MAQWLQVLREVRASFLLEHFSSVEFGRMAVTLRGKFLLHHGRHSTPWGDAQLLGRTGLQVKAGPYVADTPAYIRATTARGKRPWHVLTCSGLSGRHSGGIRLERVLARLSQFSGGCDSALWCHSQRICLRFRIITKT